MNTNTSWKEITAFLPVGDVLELRAAAEVYSWLQGKRLPHTRAVDQPHPYEGYWWNTENGADVLYRDRITIVFVDVNWESELLASFLSEFHLSIKLFYATSGSPQAEIWITVADIDIPFA